MNTFFPEVASSYAGDIDGLILLIALVVGFWFLIAQGVLFWFLFRYRRAASPKAAYITGLEPELTRWVNIPHGLVILCDVVLIVGALRVWDTVKMTLPEADQNIRIEAQQWAWTFTHPGPDGTLDTPDDIRTVDALYLEKDQVYHFELGSADVVHSFSVPAFRLKQDAVPGRTIRGWFKPTKLGIFDVQCAEICGLGHGYMAGRLTVHTAAEHEVWVAGHGAQASRQGEGK